MSIEKITKEELKKLLDDDALDDEVLEAVAGGEIPCEECWLYYHPSIQ